MNTDITMQLLSLQQGKTQELAQIAILRKSHAMDMQLVDMIDEVTQSAPAPAGQGRLVDKRA